MTSKVIMGSAGIWYAYLEDAEVSGDGEDYLLTLKGQDVLGNGTLFLVETTKPNYMTVSCQAIVSVEMWFYQASEILADREVCFHLDKGEGGEMTRGRSKIVGNYAQARYQGILQAGESIGFMAKATSDLVRIAEGYVSVTAIPV